MIPINTLTSPMLDAWLARTEGIEASVRDGQCFAMVNGYAPTPYYPTREPKFIIDLIDREKIHLLPLYHMDGWGAAKSDGVFLEYHQKGDTIGEAVARTYLMSKFGESLPRLTNK